VIQTVLENAREPETGALATIFGVLTLLFGASGVFVELRDALNRAWEVKARQVSGVVALIRDRVLSFGMVLAVGFLLLVSLVVSAALAAAGKFVEGILPLPEFVLQGVNFLTSIAVITLLFAMIYRFVPDVKIAWRDVWLGAGMTALLFTVGKFAIGMYLGKAGVGSAYGAAGALVVFLVWVYYSAQIFFFGAEFTQVYAHSRGSRASGESSQPAPRQAGDAAAEPPAVPLGFPIPAAPQPPTVALATAGPGVRYGVPAVWLAAMLAAGWLNKKIGRTGR
jgi:membrane protein